MNSSNPRRLGSKPIWLAIGAVVVVGLLALNALAISRYSAVEGQPTPRPWHSPPPYLAEGWEKSEVQDAKLWQRVFRSVVSQSQAPSDSMESLEIKYFRSCWTDPRWFRLYSDPLCTNLWLRFLQFASPEYIDKTLAVVPRYEKEQVKLEHEGMKVKTGQNGGMRVTFEHAINGPPLRDWLKMSKEANQTRLNTADAKRVQPLIRGYWKPCYGNVAGNKESWIGEVVAFHIDRVAAFYRTPAVAPVVLSDSTLQHLAGIVSDPIVRDSKMGPVGGHPSAEDIYDPDAPWKVGTAARLCANPPGYVTGAMVGWLPVQLSLLSRANGLKDKMLIEFDQPLTAKYNATLKAAFQRFEGITASSPATERAWGVEIVAAHMFAILVGNLGKFNHNLFVLQRDSVFGPFSYVDNDRSKWDDDVVSKGKVDEEYPLGKICKFPLTVAKRLLALQSLREPSLGQLVRMTTSEFNSSGDRELFTRENAAALDRNADYLVSLIKRCLSFHPVDSVLIPDPWGETHFRLEDLFE